MLKQSPLVKHIKFENCFTKNIFKRVRNNNSYIMMCFRRKRNYISNPSAMNSYSRKEPYFYKTVLVVVQKTLIKYNQRRSRRKKKNYQKLGYRTILQYSWFLEKNEPHVLQDFRNYNSLSSNDFLWRNCYINDIFWKEREMHFSEFVENGDWDRAIHAYTFMHSEVVFLKRIFNAYSWILARGTS